MNSTSDEALWYRRLIKKSPRDLSLSFIRDFLLLVFFQISEREEVAIAEKEANRIGSQTRLERLLGLFERHDFVVLSVRFAGTAFAGCGSQTFNYRRWRHNAADSRAPEERLYILFEHRFRRRLFVSGNSSFSWIYVYIIMYNTRAVYIYTPFAAIVIRNPPPTEMI